MPGNGDALAVVRAKGFHRGLEQEMLAHARTRTESIQAAGIRLVLEGRTTLDEVIRVAGLGED